MLGCRLPASAQVGGRTSASIGMILKVTRAPVSTYNGSPIPLRRNLHCRRYALVSDYASGIGLTAAGSVSLEPIVTHELDLIEAARAFELVQASSSMKVLMKV